MIVRLYINDKQIICLSTFTNLQITTVNNYERRTNICCEKNAIQNVNNQHGCGENNS